MVGGQDELVFDGASFVLNADRTLGAQLPAFREDVALTRWRRDAGGWHCTGEQAAARVEEGDKADYAACVLGLARLRRQERLQGRGARSVRRHRLRDLRCDGDRRAGRKPRPLHHAAVPLHLAGVARRCGSCVAKALGVTYDILPIEQAVLGLEAALKPAFEGQKRDVTEENLQARARGTILMGISNKFGLMVVTTGNKSEMSVGYATLYGDMNGGFNPIKDLYKTRGVSAVAPAQRLEAGRRARACQAR